MKITDIKSHPSALTNISQREDRRAGIESSRASFGDTLRKTEEIDLETRLNHLMGEIEQQGAQLAKTMDIKELRNYKKLVAEFLDEVVNGSLKFSKKSHFDRRGRHKVYAMIKKVNAKIEELSREFLKGEKDNIKILDSIDGIRGMLMDIFA